MAERTAIFGAGKMGLAAGRHYLTRGFEVTMIDPDKRKKAAVTESGITFAHLQNPRSTTELLTIIKDTSIWHVASPTPTHYDYLLTAYALRIPRVYLEKPSVFDITLGSMYEGNKGESKPLVQVGYVERANPVVLAIRDDMKRCGFIPNEFHHHRSRDVVQEAAEKLMIEVPEEYKRFTMRDLVHDISNVDFFLTQTLGTGAADGKVTFSQMQSWKEAYGEEYPWDGDVHSRFTVEFPGIVSAYLEGHGNSNYQRSFMIVNRERNLGYFGQTLQRDSEGIHPFAVRVDDWASVNVLFREILRDKRWDPENFRKAIIAREGSFLDLSSYTQDPLDKMIENLIEAGSDSDLICPLRKALEIEEVVGAVYKHAS